MPGMIEVSMILEVSINLEQHCMQGIGEHHTACAG
jgi:hypothetical protein